MLQVERRKGQVDRVRRRSGIRIIERSKGER